jgi:catechol 2,3-dioxygenase-like lactoylglutathione lyase family enzyme
MPIEVVKIHHMGIRIDGGEADLTANLGFYVGETGQIHLIGGSQPSPLAEEPDIRLPHIAHAVVDIAGAKVELETRGVPYWSLMGGPGAGAEQLFRRDPNGNMIELHQVDQCRCPSVSRL